MSIFSVRLNSMPRFVVSQVFDIKKVCVFSFLVTCKPFAVAIALSRLNFILQLPGHGIEHK